MHESLNLKAPEHNHLSRFTFQQLSTCNLQLFVMHRFYLPPHQCHEPVLALTDREAHHALHVLRLRQGEHAAVLDGAGHEFHCEVGKTARDSVEFKVLQKNSLAPLPYQITLLQAIPKGKLMEFIVQKATELGVHRIVPILSERVVPHLDAESNKLEKWHWAAIDAIKQSGLAWLPQVEAPVTLKDYLNRSEKFDLPLIASLRNDSRHPREVFQTFQAERRCMPRTLAIWIGPEGDFSPAEMNAVRAAGALPITLGPVILRTETAALYCLSILNYELQAPAQKGV
jgi:16S rRNA (uracil1498-N3)-methyltransferase